MDEIKNFLTLFTVNQGASFNQITQVESSLSFKLPVDYKAFLLHSNGGEGFIGSEYLVLFKSEELLQFNREYQVDIFAPGLFLFGSNGAGEGFVFDCRENRFNIVLVPFIGMSLNDAIHIADNFFNLLERMSQPDGSLF